MESFGIYLLSVSVCLAAMYLLYVAFFRFATFFMVNRYYLLGSLVFSFVVPLLELSIAGTEYELFATHPVATPFQSQANEFIRASPIVAPGKAVQYFSIIAIVYYAGLVAALLRICYSISTILKIKNQAESSYFGDFRILRADITQPFSFFNFIFLPKDQIDLMIIEHEKVHVRQFHSLDLIIAEIAGVLLWFNPLMVFYKRSMKAQHEYLADAYMIRDPGSIESYLTLLWNRIQFENSIGPISHFYSKSIKNRIIMITKQKTSRKFYWLYLLMIPLACALLSAFSTTPPGESISDQAASIATTELTIIVDPGHGGSDIGATSESGLVEKELTLALAKQMQVIGNRKGVKVILTRAHDESLSLTERTSVSERFPASIFLSLHINSHKDASKSGIECIISENNIAFEQSRSFSNLLLNELKTIKGIGVNGVMHSDFHVLKNNKVPAIALELGYLSNNADHIFISKVENQKMLAERIMAATIAHLK